MFYSFKQGNQGVFIYSLNKALFVSQVLCIKVETWHIKFMPSRSKMESDTFTFTPEKPATLEAPFIGELKFSSSFS